MNLMPKISINLPLRVRARRNKKNAGRCARAFAAFP
jgi:hypothetical protein